MNIRKRMAGVLAGTGLGVAGAIHLLWAAGSSWPAADRDVLADLVVGVRPFPPTVMTLGVVGAIGTGAWLVVKESGVDTAEAPASGTLLDRVQRAATIGVPTVLALRGVAGLASSAFQIRPTTQLFRTWDLRLFSPLCIALALLGAIAVSRAPSADAFIANTDATADAV